MRLHHNTAELILAMALLASSLFFGACAGQNPVTSPTALPIPTAASATATAIHADVILTESQHQIPTAVQVGQIINVSNFPNQKWTVNFYDQVLAPLTPPDRMSQPGPEGWFFRVIAPGSTEIALESVPPTCPAGTTCPPSITRLVFPIQATR